MEKRMFALDPTIRITPLDSGFLLEWRSAGMEDWTMEATESADSLLDRLGQICKDAGWGSRNELGLD